MCQFEEQHIITTYLGTALAVILLCQLTGCDFSIAAGIMSSVTSLKVTLRGSFLMELNRSTYSLDVSNQ